MDNRTVYPRGLACRLDDACREVPADIADAVAVTRLTLPLAQADRVFVPVRWRRTAPGRQTAGVPTGQPMAMAIMPVGCPPDAGA